MRTMLWLPYDRVIDMDFPTKYGTGLASHLREHLALFQVYL